MTAHSETLIPAGISGVPSLIFHAFKPFVVGVVDTTGPVCSQRSLTRGGAAFPTEQTFPLWAAGKLIAGEGFIEPHLHPQALPRTGKLADPHQLGRMSACAGPCSVTTLQRTRVPPLPRGPARLSLENSGGGF